MRTIAFAGMPGAGKSVAVEIARQRNLPVLRMGDAVWDEVRARGLDVTNTNVGRVATELRERYGKGIWAERTCDRIFDMGEQAPVVVIDGVRSQDEVDIFRARLGDNFLVVAIHASPETRFDRLVERRREDDVTTVEEFHGRDERELGWGIGRVIALSDVMILNEGEVGDLHGQISALLDGKLPQMGPRSLRALAARRSRS